MSTLHATQGISGDACNVSLGGVFSIGAGVCESVRAGQFRSEVGVASAGSVLVLRRLVWCAKRNCFKTRNSPLPMAGRVRLCTRLKKNEKSQANTHRKSTNAKTHRL